MLFICTAVVLGAFLIIGHLVGAAVFGLFLFLGAIYELSYPDNAYLRGRRPGARTRVRADPVPAIQRPPARIARADDQASAK